MYVLAEGFLLLVYYATKERFYEFFMLSRRVHRARVRKLKEFADAFYPLEMHGGNPKDYLQSAAAYRKFQYILMLLLFLILILGVWVCGTISPE